MIFSTILLKKLKHSSSVDVEEVYMKIIIDIRLFMFLMVYLYALKLNCAYVLKS